MLGKRVVLGPDDLASGVLLYGFPRAQIDLAGRALRLPVSAEMLAAQHRSMALAWVARGAWDSALVAAARYSSRTPSPDAALYTYRLSAIGVWLGAVDSSEVSSRRITVARLSGQLSPAARDETAWVDGLLAALHRDARELDAARRKLLESREPTAPLIGRALAAFALDVAGDRTSATDSLVALERDRAEHRRDNELADRHPYFTAVNRLTASRWLFAAGDTAGAARLLTWHEAVLFPLPRTELSNAALAELVYLERARLEDALGRHEMARAYYEQFLERYDMPVPAHRALVSEARAAITRAGRERVGSVRK